MKFDRASIRHLPAIVMVAALVAITACSKADKAADDIAAMRALAEKQEADKKLAQQQEDQENVARFAAMKAQAASDAKALGRK